MVDNTCTFDQITARNLSTAIFYAITVMVVLSVLAAVMTFPLEIPIFIREVLILKICFYNFNNILFQASKLSIPLFKLLSSKMAFRSKNYEIN